MSKMQLMYWYNRGQDAQRGTHQFSGQTGYQLNREPGLSVFWDEKQTLIIPTEQIVNVHIQ